MTPERRMQIESTYDASLTAEEMADGYHFCHELDWALELVENECEFCGFKKILHKIVHNDGKTIGASNA